jgi:DNA helicase-2/ATP-dependent DNA helicase PcrA
VWGQEQFNPPSRFLKEIPNELVQFTTSMETPKFMSRLQGSGNYAGSNFVSRHTGGRNTMSNDVFPDYESSENPNDSFSKGMNVRHPTFGFGSVFEVEGSGEQQKITVLFADQTIKKFVAKYARLEKA